MPGLLLRFGVFVSFDGLATRSLVSFDKALDLVVQYGQIGVIEWHKKMLYFLLVKLRFVYSINDLLF